MAMENPKQAARKFVEHWTFRRGSEKGEDQQSGIVGRAGLW